MLQEAIPEAVEPDGSARVRKFVFLVAVLMAYPVLGIAGPSSARLAAMAPMKNAKVAFATKIVVCGLRTAVCDLTRNYCSLGKNVPY